MSEENKIHKQGKENRKCQIIYKFSIWEETISMIIIVLSGFAFLTALSRSTSLDDAFSIFTKFLMIVLFAYIFIISVREYVIKELISINLKSRIQQIKIVTKKLCNKEIEEIDIIKAINEINRKKEGRKKEQNHNGSS